MKTLVIFYSRTDVTHKVAEELAQKLNADLEEIKDTQNRSGIFRWIKSGYQANRKKLTTLEPIKNDPEQYDLVVIGTPVWAGKMSVPVRTYLHQNRDKIKAAAFFCTMGSSGMESTFKGMEEYVGMPVATIGLRKKDVESGIYNLESFINPII
jgi:flavodoxin